jgi:hypothetical protein
MTSSILAELPRVCPFPGGKRELAPGRSSLATGGKNSHEIIRRVQWWESGSRKSISTRLTTASGPPNRLAAESLRE